MTILYHGPMTFEPPTQEAKVNALVQHMRQSWFDRGPTVFEVVADTRPGFEHLCFVRCIEQNTGRRVDARLIDLTEDS